MVVLCSLAAALAYHGTGMEAYSPLNHFISELGEVGVSRLAWLFNGGLIVSGLLFLPFSVGLALVLPGWAAKLGFVAGIVAALSLAAVGVFPMNDLDPHVVAALTYFRSGLLTILLFGIAIQVQPPGRVVVDKRANLASLLAVLSFAAFLVTMQAPAQGGSSGLDLSGQSARPAVLPLAILEWAVFFSTVLWFFVIALAGGVRRKLT